MAPASIYNYFGSKDGLLKATAKNLLVDSFKEKERLWESNRPFPEIIKHALSIKDNFIEQTNQEFLKEIITTDPEIKTLFDDFYVNKYPSIIEKFIEKGRSEGYIRKELSIKAAMLYLKMYQNFIQQESELLTNETVILKELFDLMLYGLAGQPIHD